jgi:competence protein ComEA
VSSDRLNRGWLIVTACLVLLLIILGLSFLLRSGPGREITLETPVPPQSAGQVLIDGAVAQPGIYPLNATDTIAGLLAAAGGATSPQQTENLHLNVGPDPPGPASQKIDINHADAWLLEALPDIGASKAQAIVDYRTQNGQFHNIQDIALVPGISASIFQKIEGLISVSP